MSGSDHYKRQGRVPKGVPSGGEFTGTLHSEGGIELGDFGDAEFAEQRYGALTEGGFVPAVAVATQHDPARAGNQEHLEEWWNEHFATSERVDGGDYTKMPDDYTPSRTSGRAFSGKRRTHRMRYAGAGVTLRSPSATSIRRFEKENGGTFDVPITAEVEGNRVSGWVRVTRTGDRWHTTALGFPDRYEAKVAEGLSAVLEARRVTTALDQAGDLLERRRSRIEEAGTPIHPVNSSFIKGVAYEDETGTMVVEMGSRSYGYKVDADVFEAVRGAQSPGRAYNRLVKGEDRAEVSRCEGCGRFRADGAAHSCPSSHGDRSRHTDAMNEVTRSIALAYVAPRSRSTPRPEREPERTPTADPAPDVERPRHAARRHDHDLGLRDALRSRGRQPIRDLTGSGALFARRGWTTDLAEALTPHTGSDYVPYAYEFTSGHVRTEGADVLTVNGDSDQIYFDGIRSDTAEAMVGSIPPSNLAAATGGAPPVGSAIDATIAAPGRYELGGYLIGPDRNDEGVRVDLITAPSANLSRSGYRSAPQWWRSELPT